MTRPVDHTPPNKLLVSRKYASSLLGDTSTQTLIRLEKSGLLDPIKLDPSKRTSPTFYTMENILRIAKGAAR